MANTSANQRFGEILVADADNLNERAVREIELPSAGTDGLLTVRR